MLDIRTRHILTALGIGAALACMGWLLFGQSIAKTRIEELQEEAALATSPQIRNPGAEVSAATSANPLFDQAAEPVVRLDGVSRSPGRRAALLSINNGPAQWLSMGETHEGVTLADVGPSRVVIDSIAGPATLMLGQTSGPASGDPSSLAVGSEQPPPGVRLPPPPASAPGA